MIKEDILERKIQLTLTTTEANWLKGIMQNPLGGQAPDQEDFFCKEMRRKFFDCLDWIQE